MSIVKNGCFSSHVSKNQDPRLLRRTQWKTCHVFRKKNQIDRQRLIDRTWSDDDRPYRNLTSQMRVRLAQRRRRLFFDIERALRSDLDSLESNG
jgi:hypothetical protein